MIWVVLGLLVVIPLLALALRAGGSPRPGGVLATCREWGVNLVPELVVIALTLALAVVLALLG